MLPIVRYAIVIGKGGGVFVQHAHETGVTGLVRAVGVAAFVHCGDEEHVQALDEILVAGHDAVLHDGFIEPVGETPGIEPVLQLPVSIAVNVGHKTSCPQRKPDP
jgi:hypothetical protein